MYSFSYTPMTFWTVGIRKGVFLILLFRCGSREKVRCTSHPRAPRLSIVTLSSVVLKRGFRLCRYDHTRCDCRRPINRATLACSLCPRSIGRVSHDACVVSVPMHACTNASASCVCMTSRYAVRDPKRPNPEICSVGAEVYKQKSARIVSISRMCVSSVSKGIFRDTWGGMRRCSGTVRKRA